MRSPCSPTHPLLANEMAQLENCHHFCALEKGRGMARAGAGQCGLSAVLAGAHTGSCTGGLGELEAAHGSPVDTGALA